MKLSKEKSREKTKYLIQESNLRAAETCADKCPSKLPLQEM